MTVKGLDRRRFLSRLVGGSAALALVGCAGARVASEGGDGAIEVLPRRDGLWYANSMPTTIPAVRNSAPVAPQYVTSKAFE
jgi:hypothetical protein